MFELRRLPVLQQKAVSELLAQQLAPKDKKKDKQVFDKRVVDKAVVVFACNDRLKTDGIPKLLVDSTADGVIGGFFDHVATIVKTLNDRIAPLDAEQRLRRDAAQRLMQTALSRGKGFLRADMSIQYAAFRTLVAELETEKPAADVKTLGIGYLVRHVKAHLAPYGHATTAPDGSSIEKASDDWHAAYESFAIAVRDRYETDPATQALLLGPYQKEVDAHIEAQRVARAKLKAKKQAAATSDA